jgi:hypothetical protein
MHSRRVLVSVGLIAACAIAAFVWGTRREARPAAPARSANTDQSSVRRVHPNNADSIHASAKAEPSKGIALRDRLRKSRDYAVLVSELVASARGGNQSAAYVVGEALKYCDENLSRFFRKPDGSVRSLNDAQTRWANRPAGYQAEIVDVYERCYSFLDDAEPRTAPSSWSNWLDQAAAAGYPPAQAEKADAIRIGALRDDHSTLQSVTLDNARNLAVSAAQSGDPDALIKMANWVDSKNRTSEEYGNLVSAWQLLACQRGYDCGESSEWLRSMCNWDPQCASGQTVADYLQRQLGTRFDDVQKLAKTIAAAVDGQDGAAIQSHL